MQEYGGLRPTGVVNPETLELVKAGRCGNSDTGMGRGGRTKRYVLGSKGWRKRTLTYK